jgi:hypothetical protein
MSSPTATEPNTSSTDEPPKPKFRLVDMEITNQSDALQVMCHFLAIAQQKGAFTLEESSKIWEAFKLFIPPRDHPLPDR